MSLIDVYCLFNRARGTGTLIHQNILPFFFFLLLLMSLLSLCLVSESRTDLTG